MANEARKYRAGASFRFVTYFLDRALVENRISLVIFVTSKWRYAGITALIITMMPFAALAAPDPAASRVPVVSPSPAASDVPSDPCGGVTRLLATLNRPTIGYSACVVPKGSIVLENGYQNQSQGGDSPGVATTIGQGFQRVGIAERVELDLIAPTFNRASSGGTLATGYNDLGLGFKVELPQGGKFTYGVDGLFTAATGTGGFSMGGPSQTFNFNIAYAASPAIGFGSTLAFTSAAGNFTTKSTVLGAAPTSRIERYGFAMPSLVVTAQIPNAYQFYVELVGQTKLGPAQGGRIFADFGVQKLFGQNLELDTEYGNSFTPIGGSRFHYIGVGAGVRVK